jgi:glycosyltransferase involved in cell wall biosynthesis
MEVYFVGRGAAQKRVHLIANIAENIHGKKLPVHFNFVGDVSEVIDISKYPFCTFWGNVKDEEQMKKIYRTADVLIMTSLFEGLPVVVMQMMAHGKPVISTAVNGIPDYIKNNENGLLIYSVEEEAIIKEGIRHIEYLLENPDLKIEMGRQGHLFAMKRFSKDEFCRAYHELMFTKSV